jgi:cyclophilin family peptidyl-prolyl cis-trans isomerase
MRNKIIPIVLALIASLFIIVALVYIQGQKNLPGSEAVTASSPAESASPAPNSTDTASETPAQPTQPTQKEQKVSNPNPDLTADANGLSKATVIMTTNKGVIKFKFYPKDAPNTVKRMIELINQGFYNGLAFHRVVPGFVIQGGDPLGNGTGGSGQKQKAEFNTRRHIEGTVAMARAQDPDSADSQFYISLGTHPHLDRNYTVFGQLVEGQDVARQIQVGDKMQSVVIE